MDLEPIPGTMSVKREFWIGWQFLYKTRHTFFTLINLVVHFHLKACLLEGWRKLENPENTHGILNPAFMYNAFSAGHLQTNATLSELLEQCFKKTGIKKKSPCVVNHAPEL